MWREYTRETPARPFLAPLGAGLALAAALGLAWLVGTARAGPAVWGPQSPPHWPVEFTLPEGFTWVQQDRAESSVDGMIGNLAYEGRSSDLVPSVLGVSFAVLPAGTAVDRAAVELLGLELADARPTRLGPLEGKTAEARSGAEVRILAAVAVSERGLAVAVQLVSPRLGSGERSAFQAVCRSIQYRKWWVRKPEDGVRPPNPEQ